MPRLKEIVIEAENPQHLARFRADLLDEFTLCEYDQSEIERLAETGKTPETDPSVALDGPGIVIFLNETRRPKTEGGHIHLGVIGDSLDGEVTRVIRLGASIKVEREGYTVLLDPEGYEFCIQGPSDGEEPVPGLRDDI
jgi:hypothetical protein